VPIRWSGAPATRGRGEKKKGRQKKKKTKKEKNLLDGRKEKGNVRLHVHGIDDELTPQEKKGEKARRVSNHRHDYEMKKGEPTPPATAPVRKRTCNHLHMLSTVENGKGKRASARFTGMVSLGKKKKSVGRAERGPGSPGYWS